MRYKATFVTGFATGYVLGSKAGRKRYEQIVAQWRSFMGKTEVKQVTETAMQEAGDLLGTAKRVVTDTFVGKDVTQQVTTHPDVSIRV